MALNIGNLNFGVDANTAGLKKAIQQLDQFQRKTNAVARSQAKGSGAVAKSMGRQETAVKKAFQQTLALQQQLRKSGASRQRIASVSRAFNRLTKEMTSGKLSAIDFARSQDAFAAKLGRSRRALNAIRAASRSSGKGLQRLSIIARDLESSAVLAVGPLSGLGARIRAISAIAGRGHLIISAWVAGITLAIAAVIKLGAIVLRSAIEMERFQARFELATGSIEAGRREMNFILATSKDLGLNINALGRGYSRLTAASRGTNLEGEATRKIFLSVAGAAAAMKLSAVEVEGIFRAIEQMMSKGTVQAEELRGQLGERLPGAFRLAADAMGVSTKELGRLLKAGDVLAEDMLPRLARAIDDAVGDAAEKNINTLSGSLERLNTTWTIFLDKVNRTTSVGRAARAVLRGATATLEVLGGTVERATKEMEAWNLALEALALAEAPLKLTKAFDTMFDAIEETAKQGQILENVLLSMEGARGPEELLRFFTNLTKVVEGTPDDFEAVAAQLSELVGRDVAANVFDITTAWTELQNTVAASQSTFDAAVTRIANTKEALKAIPAEIDIMRARLAALQQGPASLDVFEKFTSVVEAVRTRLAATNIPIQEQIRLLNEFSTTLAQIQAQEKANEAQVRRDRDRASAAERLATAIDRGVAATDRLRERTKALASGTDGLRIYEQIQEPLMRYEEQLRRVTQNEALINALLMQRREALMAILALQDNVNAAAQQSANAMANALEDVIVRGEKLQDVLRSLAQELFRVLLRATLLDPLIEGLTGGLSKIFRRGGIGTQGAPTVPASFDLGPQAAQGADFTIGGPGGTDSRLVSFIGTPGEKVSVRRPDQAMPGGGGGLTIIIQAPGADAGTVERIREMVRVELAPQIIQASTDNTMARLRRPRFA